MRISDVLQSSGLSASDATILLSALLKRDRAWIAGHANDLFINENLDRWNSWVARRTSGEPISYITGTREFFAREFLVDYRVHIPRPSTENLVSLALKFLEDRNDRMEILEPETIGIAKRFRTLDPLQTIVDVGTGSGCIAITLALERPNHRIIAIDADADALDVAKINAKRLGVTDRISFRQGSLLEPFNAEDGNFLIVTNPPYVPTAMIDANMDIKPEPRIAFEGGKDGMHVIRELWKQASAHPQCAGIVMECMAAQKDML